ncbi:hypothetical protein [Amycolatopsis regifaucium]|uniref:Uncharacterized protein n=1 Tax=Amycolatopsis regifaucium TaxID=546365 RepID=A0A154MNH3_9PSEU|nr:hypothetical protein [Amycolatopsis regifaucium]KZB85397.1 hypothetical protein AVL48_31065 [Amycolatopsis regifaucium]SFJ38424.1 hypothetical protein SAMN04489731_12030 [Amycolatopsis regifaucium]
MSALELHLVRERMVMGVAHRLATMPDVAPYLRGSSRPVAIRLIGEVLARCLDALAPGSGLSGGEDALRSLPGEPAAVRAVIARVVGRPAWEQLSGVIGTSDATSQAVRDAAEVLFDCLVDLARPPG